MHVISCSYMPLIGKPPIRRLSSGNEELERSRNTKVIKNKMKLFYLKPHKAKKNKCCS